MGCCLVPKGDTVEVRGCTAFSFSSEGITYCLLIPLGKSYHMANLKYRVESQSKITNLQINLE